MKTMKSKSGDKTAFACFSQLSFHMLARKDPCVSAHSALKKVCGIMLVLRMNLDRRAYCWYKSICAGLEIFCGSQIGWRTSGYACLSSEHV